MEEDKGEMTTKVVKVPDPVIKVTTLNPTAQVFTPRRPPLPPPSAKQTFLWNHFPGYPDDYLRHVIIPGYDAERVPHLVPQTFPLFEDFLAMIKGREEAARELYYRIDDCRVWSYVGFPMKPISDKLVREIKETLFGPPTGEFRILVNDWLEPRWYGYACFVFHTIFMDEGDLFRHVGAVRRVMWEQYGALR